MIMERKLELADICMYLPYGLKVLYYGASEDDDTQWEVRGLHHNYGVETLTGNGSVWCLPIDKIKPILRPMSDLTNLMTHPDVNGGEEFVPIRELLKLTSSYYREASTNRFTDTSFVDSTIRFVCYETDCDISIPYPEFSIPRYAKWDYDTIKKMVLFFNLLHFDHNDLIGQGLAIDINTTTL